jgi:hypothetical protein
VPFKKFSREVIKKIIIYIDIDFVLSEKLSNVNTIDKLLKLLSD